MEADEENGANVTLKRQRAPLSDSEDNVFSPPEVNDGQKRRRLEAAGRENRSPQPSSSSGCLEREMKPDTPMVPSVRSRVQQLTQRRDGGPPLAQRCLSDPGAETPSVLIHGRGLLGEEEFNHRMERFKVPLFQAGPNPTPSPGNPSPRTRSNFVSAIQQKLHGETAPSSKKASDIRQEREKEMSQVPFQPISENAWLKRSSSDPSLSQQMEGEAEMKDGSFTEAPSSSAAKPASDSPDEKAPGDSEAPAELHPEDEGWGREGKDAEQRGGRKPHTQTVLTLSFSEEQSFSKAPFGDVPTADEQSWLESSRAEQSDTKETVSIATEPGVSEVLSFEEIAGPSCSGEGMELSTEEEFRSWRYPQDDDEEEEEDVGVQEEEKEMESSRVEKEKQDSEISGSSEWQQGEKRRPEEDRDQSGTCVDQTESDGDQENMEAWEEFDKGTATEERGFSVESQNDIKAVTIKEEVALESEVNLTEASSRADVAQTSLEPNVNDGAERQRGVDGPAGEAHKAEGGGGESSKKVTFLLEPELIEASTLSEARTSMESRPETSLSEAELSSHDETNTAEIIDQMFEEVLEYAGRMEEEEERREDEDTEDHDSGIGVFSGDKDKLDTESEKEKSEEEESKEERDELLTFPPSGILSPLSKSVEAVVTPLRLAASLESNPPSLLMTPEETATPAAESAPLYSIDAYRTQRQSKLPTIQSVTPAVKRRAPEKTRPPPPPACINTKEKIMALNEEAGKLQTVINQTLQALSCCTDEDHGRGSLEEAEAEKLLLVSCEKRSALLAEVVRLREDRNSESGEDRDYVSQQACRGTVSITNIQLPLKVEFVCSSHNRTGRPSHYFFVLIRYGPCNIVATPLATAADAQNGDTISFPTAVTLTDIRSSFEIDVEVYSLSHTAGSAGSSDRTATKSRVTPRKLLNTLTRSSNSLTAAALPAVNTRRSSSFCLVGSHQITLGSLGHGRFPLDKMKLETKIRRLLGDEFQEKVPFLSPLEGSIYLRLDSQSHSDVQHRGFLTMFELISGYGVWHRRYFLLEGCTMTYWNHPNDRETKEAEGSMSLSSTPSQSVRPVKRDSCARPFTFELVSNISQQQQDAGTKRWFSADTKQERLDWMEKLNQALLDHHTWERTSETEHPGVSGSGNLRESIL